MTAALEGDEWSAARPGRTLPPEKTRYPFYRKLGGPQGQSGRALNLVPIGIRSRTFQPVVSRYTDWATRSPKRLCTYIYIHLCFNKLENKRKIFMKLFDTVRHTCTMILNHFQLTQNRGGENCLVWTNTVSLNRFVFGVIAPTGPGPSHSRGFTNHTQRRTTVSRTPLDEWSACRRDL